MKEQRWYQAYPNGEVHIFNHEEPSRATSTSCVTRADLPYYRRQFKLTALPPTYTVGSLDEFLDVCRNPEATSDDVYQVFEYHLATKVRNEILRSAPKESAEPVRDALNALGEKHNVPVLKNY